MDEDKLKWLASKGIVRLEEPIVGASQWHRFEEPKTWRTPLGWLYTDSYIESHTIEELEVFHHKIMAT